eukprot:c15392_g1_i1.p1 GENE.c15392_g1_i1~~c15392_g1_i1.p1  ORF type:complete len:450 (+),score=100.54 c15392_g1_i1:51-1400(+)
MTQESSQENRAEAIDTFHAITQLPREQCESFLQAHDWNLEIAVATHYAIQTASASPVPAPPTAAPRAPPTRPRVRLPPAVQNPRQRNPPSLFIRIITTAAAVLTWLLPRRVVVFVQQNIIPRLGLPVGDAAAVDGGQRGRESFEVTFERLYGSQHPVFSRQNYRASLQAARNQFQFLVVYLHSSHHYNTPAFCRNVLSNPDLIRYINETFVFWAGDIDTPEAFQLSQGARDFPCLLVVTNFNVSSPIVLHRIEGLRTAESVQGELQRVLEERGHVLVGARLDFEERDQERRLRDEQEEAFRQAELEDQIRERQEREEQEIAEAIKRAALAEEEERRRAEEDVVRQRLQAVEERVKRRESLQPEPEAGAEGVTKIAIRTPKGGFTRRFLKTDTLQTVKTFVDTLETGYEDTDFCLVTTRPRCVLTNLSETLEQAGLYPNGTLFLEDVPKD